VPEGVPPERGGVPSREAHATTEDVRPPARKVARCPPRVRFQRRILAGNGNAIPCPLRRGILWVAWSAALSVLASPLYLRTGEGMGGTVPIFVQ
jgi:hypothetical protein